MKIKKSYSKKWTEYVLPEFFLCCSRQKYETKVHVICYIFLVKEYSLKYSNKLEIIKLLISCLVIIL